MNELVAVFGLLSQAAAARPYSGDRGITGARIDSSGAAFAPHQHTPPASGSWMHALLAPAQLFSPIRVRLIGGKFCARPR
jgi:hypothetical protein